MFKKIKYTIYLNDKDYIEKFFSLEEIENGSFLKFKKDLLNKYQKNESDLIVKTSISTNMFIEYIKNNENEIFENEIVYSKKLKDFAIVEWHNIIGAWTVLFEEIGHDKCLFLFLEEDDLIKVGDYIEINGSNNYDKLCEEFLLKIEKND